MSQPASIGATSGPLVLADISGYTGFLQDVTEMHRDDAFAGGNIPAAYGLISTLLDGIIGRLAPPFTLSKLEGDAVFAFARSSDPVPHGDALLDCIRACYASFRVQVAGAESVWSCRCAACSRVDLLDLKFVIHAGSFAIAPMGGGLELIGPEVVMAHRLLKNGAAAQLGVSAYALFTDAAVAALDVPLDGTIPAEERYEHYAPIGVRLLPLRERMPILPLAG